MKNGKRLTKKQKIAVRNYGLNPANWLVYRVEPECFHIVHRYTTTKRKIILQGEKTMVKHGGCHDNAN